MQEASIATPEASPVPRVAPAPAVAPAIRRLLTGEITTLRPGQSRGLWERATCMGVTPAATDLTLWLPRLPPGPDDWAAATASAHAERLARRGAALSGDLPVVLRDRLRRFARRGSRHQTLVVRGLLPDAGVGAVGPTPVTCSPEHEDPAATAAAVVLLAAMQVLGEPFGFSTLDEGRLVQHVLATPGRLGWHVEDAFCEERADYVGLLCLRGAPDAATLSSTVTGQQLAPIAELLLREPRFTAAPDAAHGEQDPTGFAAPPTRPVPVLSGPAGDLRMRVDSVYLAPADPRDRAARHALHHLHDALDLAAVEHVLEPGDLLVLDNRRAAHARTGFAPRFDGTDRWLLRVMVNHPARHRRRGGVRLL